MLMHICHMAVKVLTYIITIIITTITTAAAKQNYIMQKIITAQQTRD